MNEFARQIIGWIILIAIIWDTILTAYLLRVFLVLKHKLEALERSGKAHEAPGLD